MANDPNTYIAMHIGKAIPAESYHPASVIARQSFIVQVRALRPSGSLDPTYYGYVDIYANSTTSDFGFLIGRAFIQQGSGLGSASVTVSSVYNESSFRKITVRDADNKRASMNVGVWFRGRATVFAGNRDSYYVERGCTPLTTNYAALPSYNLCRKNVVVTNVANNRAITAPVNDVGPYFDSHYCGSDEYWKNGTVPRAEQPGYSGRERCQACNVPCETVGDRYRITGAIIDISQAMMTSLGGNTEITSAWRFT